jgi:hypothetical protein
MTDRQAHEYDRLNWWCQGWIRKLNASIRVCNRLSGGQRDKLASVIGKLRDRFDLACERRKPAAEALLQRKPNKKAKQHFLDNIAAL